MEVLELHRLFLALQLHMQAVVVALVPQQPIHLEQVELAAAELVLQQV
jgi:hypothetical protein